MLSGRPTSSRCDRVGLGEQTIVTYGTCYLIQLEQTVTKLQSVLALSPDQVAAIPPPLIRIRELEQENELLHREVEELRRQLEMKNSQLRPDFRRDNYTPLPDDRHFDRESKRRRTADVGGVYVVRCSAHTGCRPSHAALHRHPPLTPTLHLHPFPSHLSPASTPRKARTLPHTRRTRRDRWATTTRMVCRDIPCRRRLQRRARRQVPRSRRVLSPSLRALPYSRTAPIKSSGS